MIDGSLDTVLLVVLGATVVPPVEDKIILNERVGFDFNLNYFTDHTLLHTRVVFYGIKFSQAKIIDLFTAMIILTQITNFEIYVRGLTQNVCY